MIKKIFYLLTTILLIFMIPSCASTTVNNDADIKSEKNISAPNTSENKIATKDNDNVPGTSNSAKIKKYNRTMFWEIKGKDKNGETATVYVLGTIHVGDERLYPVPTIIEKAYDNADRIVGELSTDAWEVMSIATNKMKNESAKREKERVRQTGKTLSDYLTEDEKNYLLSYVKNENIINKFEPWFLTSELSEIPINLSGLDSEKSYDIFFIEKSIKNERYIEGLDSVETQLSDISYGDWNTQLAMLKDSIDDLINDSDSAGNHILNVYETYLSADEKKLSKIINSNMKDDDADYSEDYYNTVFVEKNKEWAKKLENYLLEGGTTFVFAGCGHFVGDDSVFHFMAENGVLNY